MRTDVKRPSGGNAGWFDKVWRRLNELRVIAGPGLQADYTPQGTVLRAHRAQPVAPGGGGAILRAVITGGTLALNDYLLCSIEGQSGTSIPVAKPPLLRVTPYDGLLVSGVTYDYSDTNGQLRKGTITGYYEWQAITPTWLVDEVIYVTKNPDGGTGVTGADFLDINADGRCWAELFVD